MSEDETCGDGFDSAEELEEALESGETLERLIMLILSRIFYGRLGHTLEGIS